MRKYGNRCRALLNKMKYSSLVVTKLEYFKVEVIFLVIETVNQIRINDYI